jgi:hypothetical protein
MAAKELISTITLSSTTSSIDFTSIPQTYTDLVCVFSLKSNFASSDYDDLGIKANGVTTNTSYRILRAYGVSAGSGSGTGLFGHGFIAGNSSTANSFGTGTLMIPNYAGSANKTISVDSAMDNNNSNAFVGFFAGRWASTVAINQLTFYSNNGGSLLSGSTVSLYGFNKGSDGITTVA